MASTTEDRVESGPPERPSVFRDALSGSRRPASARASRVVHLMKLVLPAAALALVGLIALWPQLLPDPSQFRLGEAPLTAADADTSRLINPRFHGLDRNERPYVLSAELASQLPNTTSRFRLEHPKADMTLENGWVALGAELGHYDKTAERLDLSGGVSLFHDAGYAFRTETATIDLKAGTATGDRPIEGQGPTGTVEGSGFRITEKGDRIVFTGRSRVVIYGESR